MTAPGPGAFNIIAVIANAIFILVLAITGVSFMLPHALRR
jgi:hypothetical protein